MYDKCSDCEYTNYDNYVQKIETQQKEFINYLNSYIGLLNDKPDMLEETQKDILEEGDYVNGSNERWK